MNPAILRSDWPFWSAKDAVNGNVPLHNEFRGVVIRVLVHLRVKARGEEFGHVFWRIEVDISPCSSEVDVVSRDVSEWYLNITAIGRENGRDS